MRKVATFLTAALCLAWVGIAKAQTAPDAFKDVEKSHWAYEATESLRSKGILVGYPDTYFRGKRTLTRYEFAVALDRALKTIQAVKGDRGDAGSTGEKGDTGPVGDKGETGDAGPAGVTPEELATLKALTNEFKDELASLGNNVKAINARLDGLTKDVADINARLNKMPVISGGAFVGFRNNSGNLRGFDRDGRTLANDNVVVHDFLLGVKANIAGGAVLDAAMTVNNYKNYLGGDFATPGYLGGGNISDFTNTNPGSDTYIHHLTITAPFNSFGREGGLTVGRFGQQVSKLTLWKPDFDTYFQNPFENDGLYYMDGAKVKANFGSLGMELFAGQTKTVQGTNYGSSNARSMGYYGDAINSPFAGSSMMPSLFESTAGSLLVDQMVGLNFNLPFHYLKGGSISGGVIDLNGTGYSPSEDRFKNVYVYNVGANVNLTDRITFNGEWAKSVLGNGKFNDFNKFNPGGQNNAFDATVGYKSGSFDLNAGYKYIDPMFYAPGYWGKIGNWYNPTNIQGPTFRAAYEFSPSLGMNVGGDFFSAARNRGPNNLTMNDDIHRILAGLRWDISKSFRTTVDWEGVYYSFGKNGFGGGPATVHPTQHFITLGTGYNMTSSTLIKLDYQMGMFDAHGFAPANAINNGLMKSNFNTFTGSVAVKF